MGSFPNEPLHYSDDFSYLTSQEESPTFMYSQPTHRRHRNAMPSDGRLTPYNTPIKATTSRRKSDLSPSHYRPEYEGSYPDEAERLSLFSTSNKGKLQHRDSPPLPPSPQKQYRSTTRPSPPPLSTSPLLHGKRRRSSSPPKTRSERPIWYDDRKISRSRFLSISSRTRTRICDNYGCGGQHSHDDCPLPMRCSGCHSTRHFGANCHQVCVECGHIGHTKVYCSDFIVGRDGIPRPLELSREYAIKRQRRLDDAPPAQKDWDRPRNSPELRSDSLQRHSTQPSNPTRLSSLEPTDVPVKSSQRLAFEEEESIKQARHEADMARKAVAQKLELEHEARLLEMRRQYNTGLLPSYATSSSVLYPPYDPNGPLDIPDHLSVEASLTMNAPAAANGYEGRGSEQRVKIEKDIKYVIID